MPTLPNMGLITPTLGADRGLWDDKINAIFALIDAHDHTAGKGALITVGALDIDDDLALGGFGFDNVGHVDFDEVTALSAGAQILFVSSADSELYWRTAAGVNVQLTDGASLNTSLVGGILGDYTAVGAELAFVDVDEGYTFLDQNDDWAHIECGDLRLHEHGTADADYIAIKAPALSAPYTLTLDDALPVADAFLIVDDAGNITYANTLNNDLEVLTLYHQDSYRRWVAPADFYDPGGVHDATYQLEYWTMGSTSVPLYVGFTVEVGERITAYGLRLIKLSSGATTVTVKMWKQDATGGTKTQVGSTQTSAANNPGVGTPITIGQSSLTEDVVDGAGSYTMEISHNGAGGQLLLGAYVDVSRPA